MKIDRLTSSLPDTPRLSSPKPRLRHGRQHAHLSLSLSLSPKSLCSLFYSVSGSSSSPSSSPNFPDCSSPTKLDSVFAGYLRSHFSVLQPETLRSRASGYLPQLRWATCPEQFHSFFCSPFSSNELLVAATNLFAVAFLCLSHCHRSRQSCLSHAEAPCSLWHKFSFRHFQSFLVFAIPSFLVFAIPSIWKTCSIIPVHIMKELLDSPVSFQPIFLTSCVSKLFERITLLRLLFSLESYFIHSPRQAYIKFWMVYSLSNSVFRSVHVDDKFRKQGNFSSKFWGTKQKSKVILY